jgi:APA family basic amino acid/polyamine antiporter
MNALGVAGCLVLVATLPVQSVLAGIAMFANGLGGRWLLRRSWRTRGTAIS